MNTRQQVTATVYDKKGRVLSKGQNSYHKTHPMQAHYAELAGEPYKVYLHAEMLAIIRCKGKPHKISIERVDHNGKLKLAKPCPICELAIKRAGIKYVEYTVG